jgi:hypothetical protein
MSLNYVGGMNLLDLGQVKQGRSRPKEAHYAV